MEKETRTEENTKATITLPFQVNLLIVLACIAIMKYLLT